MANANLVVLVGNLTRDPELRNLPSGTEVCAMRLAVNDRRKNSDGEWVDYANYFDIDVFGNQANACAQYLSRGRAVYVQGRLRWREWETQEGAKRQHVSVTADRVQFLGPRDGGDGDYSPPFGATERYEPAVGQAAEPGDLVPPYTGDEDIPF
jgi:single-strand DNA-binding protein